MDELLAWARNGMSISDFEPSAALGVSAGLRPAASTPAQSGYVVTEPITAMPSRVLISDRPAPVVEESVEQQVARLMGEWLDAFLGRKFETATHTLEQVLALAPGHERALHNLARQREIMAELSA